MWFFKVDGNINFWRHISHWNLLLSSSCLAQWTVNAWSELHSFFHNLHRYVFRWPCISIKCLQYCHHELKPIPWTLHIGLSFNLLPNLYSLILKIDTCFFGRRVRLFTLLTSWFLLFYRLFSFGHRLWCFHSFTFHLHVVNILAVYGDGLCSLWLHSGASSVSIHRRWNPAQILYMCLLQLSLGSFSPIRNQHSFDMKYKRREYII